MKLGTSSSVRPLLRMNAVRRVTSPCVGILEVGRDHVLALGEVGDRPEVDVVRLDPVADERRQDAEPEHGQGDARADEPADADRREREEGGAIDVLVDVAGRGDRRSRLAARGRAHRMLPEEVAHPEEAEDEGDQRADDQRRRR